MICTISHHIDSAFLRHFCNFPNFQLSTSNSIHHDALQILFPSIFPNFPTIVSFITTLSILSVLIYSAMCLSFVTTLISRRQCISSCSSLIHVLMLVFLRLLTFTQHKDNHAPLSHLILEILNNSLNAALHVPLSSPSLIVTTSMLGASFHASAWRPSDGCDSQVPSISFAQRHSSREVHLSCPF